MAKILEKELTDKLVGVFIEVSKKYGHMHKEKIYQKACEECLKEHKISFQSQPRIEVISLDSNEKMGTYVPDFLVEDKVIVELKAHNFLPKKLIKQLEQYLKASKYEIGYLVNFGKPKVKWYRRIYTNDRKPHIN